MKDDAPRVIKIPAKPEATRQAEARRQLRVAAYCRVSTKEEDQANSYEYSKSCGLQRNVCRTGICHGRGSAADGAVLRDW